MSRKRGRELSIKIHSKLSLRDRPYTVFIFEYFIQRCCCSIIPQNLDNFLCVRLRQWREFLNTKMQMTLRWPFPDFPPPFWTKKISFLRIIFGPYSMPQIHSSILSWKIRQRTLTIGEGSLYSWSPVSVTRLGNLMDFRQLSKAFCNK